MQNCFSRVYFDIYALLGTNRKSGTAQWKQFILTLLTANKNTNNILYA